MPAEERTEAATPKKREEARKKGQVAKSVELNSSILLISAFVVLYASKDFIYGSMAGMMQTRLSEAAALEMNFDSLRSFILGFVVQCSLIMAPVLLSLLAVGVIANVIQVGFLYTSKTLVPDLNRLNPASGLSRIISPRSMIELAKSVGKVVVVGWVVYSALKNEYGRLFQLADMDIAGLAAFLWQMIYKIGMKAGLVLLIIGIADYIYQRYEFEKSIRMTKQEIKEEAKESEGDPLIKSRMRQKQRQLAMGRMMQEVPKADVVITNPTHFAVALKYDSKSMAAPKVVAKGQDYIALRIKEIAGENKIPTIENKPLAQTLFKSVDVGQEIPPDLYKSVAEILAMVYRLNKSRA